MPTEPMNVHSFSLCIYRFVEIFCSVLVVHVFDNRRSRNEYPLHKLIKFTTQPVRSCDPPEYFQFESSRQCLMFEDTVSSIES